MPPQKLIDVRATERGAHFEFEQAELEVTFLTSDFIQINWFPGLSPIPYAIVKCDWEVVPTTLTEHETGWTIATDQTSIMIRFDGSLTFCNAAGQVIREERPPERQGDRWVHRAILRSEEHIYGLGERAASLNLRAAKPDQEKPPSYQMWNYDPGGRYPPGTDPMYICIPISLGLHQAGSYLIFYENSFRAEFTLADEAIADFEGGSLRYYVAIGAPEHLLERYTELTGRPPLPARWALGYHQSRWGYRTEEAIRQEVEAFQTHELPLSAVHLDIDCQVGHRAFSLDPVRFPNLNSFTQELAKSGVRFIAINNPGIKCSRDSNLFLEGQILNAFCTYPNGKLAVAPVWAGRTAFPDFTNPTVRDWWSRQYAYLLDVGVAGFWHDMNEPAAFVFWGDHSLPQVAQHHLEGRGGDHREAHNVYGLLEAEAAYASIRQYRPQQRPFIVSRSGWAGLQRYAWTWTGDTISTWAALRQTVATVVGLSLSGVPFSGPDIGGFQGNPSAELYLRWFQMSTFLMFCRTHSSTSVSPRTPWTFGEPYLSIIRRFLQLRYQLTPYFYTLSWEASQQGHPPIRPLFWIEAQNQTLWDVEDAFLVGNALLVCPIVEPGVGELPTERRSARTVILPEGQWYDFWTDQSIAGSAEVNVDVSLEQIPVFVRAGSILPMEVEQQLVLHVYPPVQGEAESCLYSDEGEGYGAWRLDRFQMIRHATELALIWHEQGDYPFPYPNIQLHLHGVKIQQAWKDDRKMACQEQYIVCDRFRQIRLYVEEIT